MGGLIHNATCTDVYRRIGEDLTSPLFKLPPNEILPDCEFCKDSNGHVVAYIIPRISIPPIVAW